MLNSSFRSVRPNSARSLRASAALGCQSPMSEANSPVKISRTKAAPVAAAIATDAVGSHRKLTPNGNFSSGFNALMTAVMAATDSVGALNRYGLSFSLPNIIACTPFACRLRTSLPTSSISFCTPPFESNSGLPGNAPIWAIAMTTLRRRSKNSNITGLRFEVGRFARGVTAASRVGQNRARAAPGQRRCHPSAGDPPGR